MEVQPWNYRVSQVNVVESVQMCHEILANLFFFFFLRNFFSYIFVPNSFRRLCLCFFVIFLLFFFLYLMMSYQWTLQNQIRNCVFDVIRFIFSYIKPFTGGEQDSIMLFPPLSSVTQIRQIQRKNRMFFAPSHFVFKGRQYSRTFFINVYISGIKIHCTLSNREITTFKF